MEGGGRPWKLFQGTLALAGPDGQGGGCRRRCGVVVKGAVISGVAVTSHRGKARPLVTSRLRPSRPNFSAEQAAPQPLSLGLR